jgi:hypothetical protein
MFLNLQTRLYEKSCRLKKKDDDYTVNKVPCLKTCWLLPVNLPFYFLKWALLIEVLLSGTKILLKIIVIQINVHFAYRVTPSLRYWSSIGPDFIHWNQHMDLMQTAGKGCSSCYLCCCVFCQMKKHEQLK